MTSLYAIHTLLFIASMSALLLYTLVEDFDRTDMVIIFIALWASIYSFMSILLFEAYRTQLLFMYN